MLGLVLEQGGGGHKIILPSLAVFSPETARERAPGPHDPPFLRKQYNDTLTRQDAARWTDLDTYRAVNGS